MIKDDLLGEISTPERHHMPQCLAHSRYLVIFANCLVDILRIKAWAQDFILRLVFALAQSGRAS